MFTSEVVIPQAPEVIWVTCIGARRGGSGLWQIGVQGAGCRVRGEGLRCRGKVSAPPRGHEVGPAALPRGCDASVPQPLHPPHVGKHERGEEAPGWDEVMVRGRVGVGLKDH